ncbi:hypothetical protein AX17_006238 [Amanita inopinata Kibby_2008]|nr:hypothetical protein AX17_006238 [Amanita inopinata Kibby_2008]
MMRAILVKNNQGPAENLYIGDAQKPTAGTGEVIVQIKAFGLNRLDLLQRVGLYPPPPGASPIMGVEFSGVITELGPDVSNWVVGDEVLGLAGGGAYAEYIASPQTLLMKKPSHLNWIEAASIPEVFLTAFQALSLLGEIKQDDDVLIHAGASGVGVAAIQLARFFGARNVIATTSTQDKIDWLNSIPNGPTAVVNYKSQDFAAVVKQVTNNKGVDLVIDFVGQSHWNQNLDSLALDGRMILLALLSGPKLQFTDLTPILRKRLRIQGSTLRSRSIDYQADLINKFSERVMQHITGKDGNMAIKTYIHRVYPWTNIQDAHQEMEANRNSGKIVVEVVS